MKKYFHTAALAVSLMIAGCSHNPVTPLPAEVKVNPAHPLKDGLQAIINAYNSQGIPGIQVAVKDKNGWYITQGGYDSKESQTPMKGDSTTWIFSITKTYTAALIMKLKESKQLYLDSAVNRYLPDEIGSKIKKSNKITVRNLLNHSSGIANFIELDEYRERQFSDPLNQPSVPEILHMVYNEDLMFEPGSQTYYSNTNYLLLGIILEHVTGKTYEYLLRTQIIDLLGLQHTYYNLGAAQIAALGFPNYYFDADGSGNLQNGTAWNHALGNKSLYWGGIAARPTDVVLFYEALIKGKVVNYSSLQEMQQFQRDYGLGIEAYQYLPGSAMQFGHEGDGIGNSTMVLYIPAKNSYIFINCTAGRQLPGPFLNKIIDLKNDLCAFAAKG